MLKPCPFCGCTPKITVQRAPCLSHEKGKGKCGVSVLVQCEARRCKVHPATPMSDFYLPGCRWQKSWEQEATPEYERLKKDAVAKMIRVWNKRREHAKATSQPVARRVG